MRAGEGRIVHSMSGTPCGSVMVLMGSLMVTHGHSQYAEALHASPCSGKHASDVVVVQVSVGKGGRGEEGNTGQGRAKMEEREDRAIR